MFCSAFDARLAQAGPAAVFLLDDEGLWRFDEQWTRDAWQRAPGPHVVEPCWVLLRDRGSGYVNLVMVTSATLLTEHPRCDVRAYDTHDAAVAARDAWGRPPVCPEAW